MEWATEIPGRRRSHRLSGGPLMRHLTRLAVSAATILTLMACGSSSQGDAVTGTVTWPDGRLAANAQVYWYVGGYSLDSPVDYAISHVHTDGSYSIGGCPCSPLTGYLFVSSAYGADPLNGGRDCWIILQARGTYQGITANPGDVIDWQALDMPCAAYMYRSDQSDVQQEALMLNPATNGGDYSASGGSWQDAETRTNGG
jgi:hypothetical protein